VYRTAARGDSASVTERPCSVRGANPSGSEAYKGKPESAGTKPLEGRLTLDLGVGRGLLTITAANAAATMRRSGLSVHGSASFPQLEAVSRTTSNLSCSFVRSARVTFAETLLASYHCPNRILAAMANTISVFIISSLLAHNVYSHRRLQRSANGFDPLGSHGCILVYRFPKFSSTNGQRYLRRCPANSLSSRVPWNTSWTKQLHTTSETSGRERNLAFS